MGLEGFKFSPSPQSSPSARERWFKTLALFKGEGRVRVSALINDFLMK
jgi:hypothetical protein